MLLKCDMCKTRFEGTAEFVDKDGRYDSEGRCEPCMTKKAELAEKITQKIGERPPSVPPPILLRDAKGFINARDLMRYYR